MYITSESVNSGHLKLGPFVDSADVMYCNVYLNKYINLIKYINKYILYY